MAFPTDSEALSIITDHVRRPYNDEDCEPWRLLPEIPDRAEIMPADDRSQPEPEPWNEYQQEPVYDPKVPKNIVKGPWESKSKYISAHYQILREDAIAPLRRSVQSFKANPHMQDGEDTCIYTSVHFKGLQLAPTGVASRIEFSHERAGKQIRWAQSKRLVTGTMVALSPARNAFRTVCKTCIVAARPLQGGLDMNPPQIDLFWGKPEDAVFDPIEPYIMIEARSAYFEASRHMLVALQKLDTERFHLANHLSNLDCDIKAPKYLENQPFINLRSLVDDAKQSEKATLMEELQNVDILRGFPDFPQSGMDKSQMLACERMLTKKVAIIQGPPGTGKTFTSVSALRIMLDNLGPDDPPIIIAAQTNHAVDQLLNHIIPFEPNILRLGGRSDKENEEILKRTLFELRQNTKHLPKGIREIMTAAYRRLKPRVEKIKIALAPILRDDILTAESLLEDKIITQKQFDSLDDNEGWAGEDEGANRDGGALMAKWIRDQLLVSSSHWRMEGQLWKYFRVSRSFSNRP